MRYELHFASDSIILVYMNLEVLVLYKREYNSKYAGIYDSECYNVLQVGLKVNDLYEDFRDGTKLLSLLEVLNDNKKKFVSKLLSCSLITALL